MEIGMTIHLGWGWVFFIQKMAMKELGDTNHKFEESPLQCDNN
jgi:hypothetical protein